jgi:hypothetical protein
MCGDPTQGACSGSCYGVVDFGYRPRRTTCAERCAAVGKSCAPVCPLQHEGNTVVAAGLYTQQAAFGPYGFLDCSEQWSGTAPTSLRCCCSDEQTGPLMPGCMTHTDCGSGEFCLASQQECFPTVDSRCPPGYTYLGRCSGGSNPDFCIHSGLPAGTENVFEADCPAGTTERGSWFCSGTTRICVPNG